MTNHQTDMTTQLNYLGFRRFPPSPALKPYVQCYWLIQRDDELTDFHEEFWHSSGGFGMVFNWGDDLYTDGVPLPSRHFIGGNTASQKLGLHGKIEAIGVRFQAGGAYPFWKIPLYELMNGHYAVDLVGNAAMRSQFRRIEDAGTAQARIGLIETWLMRQLADVDERLALIHSSLGWIRQSKGQLAIPSLAERLYISQRQLERLYKTHVGISPKKYARLLRVEQARIAIKRDPMSSATDIGNATGFYDQAHFIREFKAIIGMTPNDYAVRSIRRQSSSEKALAT